jgi:hypothetical protein
VARPGEAQAEAAGHGRLRPAGVGRAVPRRVPPHRAPALCGRRPEQECRHEDQQGGEPGGQPVDEVVEARGAPAKVPVALRAVADHAVERVDRLVRQHARQAEQEAPEQGRDHAVRKILGGRFDRGARHGRAIEARGIAADDPGDREAPVGEAPLQPAGDRGDVLVETAEGEQAAHQEAKRQPAVRRAQAQRLHGEGEHPAGGDDDQGRQHAVSALLRRRVRGVEPARLEPGGRPPDQHHRVGHAAIEPVRVAGQRVEGEREQQAGQQRRGIDQQHSGSPACRRRADGLAKHRLFQARRIGIQCGTMHRERRRWLQSE